MKATISILIGVMAAIGAAMLNANAAPEPLRRIVSLDGTWQIAEGQMETMPADFSRTVPVPGLVDMAVPAFVEPGPKVFKTTDGKGGTTYVTFDPTEARQVRVVCTKRGTQWGNAIRELEVY